MPGLTPKQAMNAEELVGGIATLCRQVVTCSRMLHESVMRPETIPSSKELADMVQADVFDIAKTSTALTEGLGMTGIPHMDAQACLRATAVLVTRMADNVIERERARAHED